MGGRVSRAAGRLWTRLRSGRSGGRLALAVVALSWPAAPAVWAAPAAWAPAAQLTSASSTGTPTVGALVPVSGGRAGAHFCTASVIDSPAGDLLVTAAHCVAGYSDTSPSHLAFVPGYDNGTAPSGMWPVTRIFVDAAWASSADPNDDVAFLTVAAPGQDVAGRGARIEDVVGAERLGIGQPANSVVRVTGYPDGSGQPVSCQNRASSFSATQLQFDCDGYTDGTSGSPFLTDVNPVTGDGTVIGVIGGYQQGGDSPDVSYAAAFGPSVRALYDAAVAGK